MAKNLNYIFNHSIAIKYFPEIFKQSVMIFLPKANKSPYHHMNYRPILLLEVPAKLLEKIIYRRLLTLIEIKELHNNRQHGFRPVRGTYTALGILHETIATARGNGKTVDLVFRDISKAFDNVWHKGLMCKIMQGRFPDCLTRILCSYLRDRTARVRIGECLRLSFSLHTGFPREGAFH